MLRLHDREANEGVRGIVSSSILIVCLGNPLRGDDAFGLIVFRLLRRLRVPVVYAGSTPENIVHILRRVKPDIVVIVDALLGEGEGLLVSRISDESSSRLLSSHNLPLRLLFDAIELDSRKVIVIGAVAENLSLGSQPSERVWKLAVEAASLIARLLRQPLLPRELELGNEGSLFPRNVEDSAIS